MMNDSNDLQPTYSGDIDSLPKEWYITPHNPICVLAACDDKYAFCLFVAIQTLFKNSPKLTQQADIWIAGFNFSHKTKEIFNSLPRTRVIDYTFPGNYPQTESFLNFTPASFARYECFSLLNLYQKVMYLDSDVLVEKELLPMFDTLSNGIGLVPDPLITSVGRNFHKSINDFDMKARGFNSGFLALKQGANWESKIDEIKHFLYTKTLKYADNLIYPDQGIINLALQQFNLRPTELSYLYNCPASRKTSILKKAYIIHSTGPRKFWCYYYFDEFYTYYSQWIMLGGKPVSVRKSDSILYQRFIKKTNWDKYVFVQLFPDFIARPFKALRFIIKKLLHCRF